eukprot:3480167-Pyramimonas_sp.AAC.1
MPSARTGVQGRVTTRFPPSAGQAPEIPADFHRETAGNHRPGASRRGHSNPRGPRPMDPGRAGW